ncbi:hypothetical protein ACFP3Q_10975 [Nocardioides sp. GCM10027113]|uniref:hypothetical protein n=1 Tax=unclassified Nocardioides TaxID=2615069 RepID=UPI00361484AF
MTHAATISAPVVGAARFLVFAPVGLLVHAVVMLAGPGYQPWYAALALLALAAVCATALWACIGSEERLARSAPALAIVAVATLPTWAWGVPLVVGAGAAGLAVEHRLRYGVWDRVPVAGLAAGSFASMMAVLLALLA